jgi:hypothetical protein
MMKNGKNIVSTSKFRMIMKFTVIVWVMLSLQKYANYKEPFSCRWLTWVIVEETAVIQI